MDRGKALPDINFKAVEAVKLHNLSIQQVALKFNIN